MNGFEDRGFDHAEAAYTQAVLRPAGPARGVVLICPTIHNRTEAMDRRARMLADAGYIAVIGDFYGIDGPPHGDARIAKGREIMADTAGFRALLAANLASAKGAAPDLPIATIGFCMGGMAVLELARDGADVLAAISFHGLLRTAIPAPGRIAPAIMVCHGDADPMVPRDHVAEFEAEMDAAQTDWSLLVFGGAKHGFTDPASDRMDNPAVAYHARADRQGWSAAMMLLDEVFPR
ncbi:MAG TPA: dienelactone hydrolase family protein [Croceicoccus sp.]|nr:dienelactone hydrolase family protein [Croceicoccus sp.]